MTKIGVGYGKKVKLGQGFGNRTVAHRIWAQILPDDDLEESIEGLWQNVFDAYDEKIAALTMPRRVKKAPLTPDAIKAKVARFVKAYRGEKGTGASTHLRTMAMLRLQAEP